MELRNCPFVKKHVKFQDKLIPMQVYITKIHNLNISRIQMHVSFYFISFTCKKPSIVLF